MSSTFDGPNFDATQDFDWHQLYDPDGDTQAEKAEANNKTWATSEVCTNNKIDAAPALSWLWGKALAEWQDFGPCDCE